MTEKHPFIVRLIIVFPVLIIMGFVWALFGLYSTQSLGRVLKQTGENLLKP